MRDILFKALMLKGDRGGTIERIDKIAETGVTDTLRITLDDGSYVDFDVNNTVDEEKVELIIDEKTPSIVSQANNYTDTQLSGIINTIFPVGTIYMSANSANPSTYLGGTWEAWGSGRVPIGVNTNDSDFNTVEKTGGNKSNTYTPSGTVGDHTLTVAEMPAHTHGEPTGSTNGFATFSQTETAQDTGVGFMSDQSGAMYHAGYAGLTESAGGNEAHNHSFTGSGQSISTIQPYITCYMWKRTA